MRAKPVVPRAQANLDVDEAVAYYLGEDAPQAALGFIDALDKAYAHLGRHPGTGSPRYAHELNLPGLRAWPLTGYPHLVFYVDRPDHVDVWRVLHGQRDIPAWMQDAETQDYLGAKPRSMTDLKGLLKRSRGSIQVPIDEMSMGRD